MTPAARLHLSLLLTLISLAGVAHAAPTFVRQADVTLLPGEVPGRIAVGDLNADQVADILVNLGNAIVVFDGATGLRQRSSASGVLLPAGDVDDDGRQDFISRTGLTNVRLYSDYSDVSGSFETLTNFPYPFNPVTGFYEPIGQTYVDLDGDGHTDQLLSAANDVYINLIIKWNRSGAEIFESGTTESFGDGFENFGGIAVGDILADGSGTPDLVVVRATSQELFLLENDGAGDYTELFDSVTPMPGILSSDRGVSTGYYNDDSFEDVITSGFNVYLSDGAGGLTYIGSQSTGGSPTDRVTIDLDESDLAEDFAVVNNTSFCDAAGLRIIRSDSTIVDFSLPEGRKFIAAGDLTGDGLDDLAISNRATKTIHIFHQETAGIEQAVEVFLPPSPYQSVGVEDGPFGPEYVIEQRNDLLPQALTVGFAVTPDCVCDSRGIREMNLFPRSGTGRVFPVTTFPPTQSYFLIDNLTAPGYYDLEVKCGNGSVEILKANVHFLGYAGYVRSGTLTTVDGKRMRGATVNLWRYNGEGGYYLYDSMVATDGTYSFSPPSGTYYLQVIYAMGGGGILAEEITDPFEVVSSTSFDGIGEPLSPAQIDTLPPLSPTNPDSVVPELQILQAGAGSIVGQFTDTGSGISVVEVVLASGENANVTIDPYRYADETVTFRATLDDLNQVGTISLRCEDALGNVFEGSLGEIPTSAPSNRHNGNLALLPGYPNPFNPNTNIAFDLFTKSELSLRIYDASGRLVRTLVDKEEYAPGRHRILWNGRDDSGFTVGSGVYFVKTQTPSGSQTGKVALIK